MAFIVTNPVGVGDKTLKSHYDGLYDNTQFLHTNILQVNGAAGVSVGDVTYALVGTYGFRLETSTDAAIFEANGGYATNGGILVHGSGHANAGRTTVYTGKSGTNGELLVYDINNTGNTFSATFAKVTMRSVLNLFATSNFDIIPGTGTDPTTQTTTGGLRLGSDGLLSYYCGAGAGDGLRVFRAHATAPVLQMTLDSGDQDFSLYDSTGGVTFLHDMGTADTYFYDTSSTVVLTIDAEFSGHSRLLSNSGAYMMFDSGGDIKFFTSSATADLINFQNCGGVVLPYFNGTGSVPTTTGTMFYDFSDNTLKIYYGGAWRSITTA